MSGIKFEELSKIEQDLFNDFTKILNQENWFDLFVEREAIPNSHIKINVLKQLAKTFRDCFSLEANNMIVEESKLIIVIHGFRLGDAYYVKHAEKLILNYPKADLVAFIACLLLEGKSEGIDKEIIRSYLKLLPIVI
jgi:hypothetical protein